MVSRFSIEAARIVTGCGAGRPSARTPDVFGITKLADGLVSHLLD